MTIAEEVAAALAGNDTSTAVQSADGGSLQTTSKSGL